MSALPATVAATSADAPAAPTASRTGLLAFGFWTLLTLSYTLSGVLSSISEGNDPGWTRALVWNAANFYPWMALAPLVGWLGRGTANAGWGRFLAVHVPAGLAIALAQTLLHLAVFWYACGPGRMPVASLADFVRMQFAYTCHLALLTYWVILVVLRGLESRRRLRDERLRSAHLETQLAQSQLQALRMQLQPHFLFNTLNAISALALADPLRARLMIARLSDFLRMTLEQRHAQQVPLAREMEFLRCYLAIQEVRFQDRLSTRLALAEDTLHAAVPSMILQPLVENALRHGLLAKPEPGRLHIASRRDGELLHLCVEDDGLGLPPEGPADGVGLGNTRARLQVLFGAAARMDLHRRAGGGTRVELCFPFREHVA
ncbi:sensor histidine kinase [Frateuria sp. STR12]|uniref:sensor histidine kinase n=1 Tax=Frateuria hangzhouensis TaxID=2995589 RepID=UPI00226097AE|nr:histidine kinase [Frateuria sp. STR12]MCX7513390.1 histidine kinase [Frateuria sp. STR12]